MKKLKLSCRCRETLQSVTDQKWLQLKSYVCMVCNCQITHEVVEVDNDGKEKRRERGVKVTEMSGDTVTITKDNAFALRRLVGFFQIMIKEGVAPECDGRNDELTMGYCDELMEALKP